MRGGRGVGTDGPEGVKEEVGFRVGQDIKTQDLSELIIPIKTLFVCFSFIFSVTLWC